MYTFGVCDCSLARSAVGQSCSNLRELLTAIRTVPDDVLEHHMMRCPLDDHFAFYEFPNDFARWCWNALGDHVVAERLALIDPYRHGSVADMRAELADVVEDRLWKQQRVPWCRPGLELHLVASRLVAYDTGEWISTPTALVEAIPRMSLRSLFFHVHEARRRTGGQSDDFSRWLEQFDVSPLLVKGIRKIDFYFLNLGELRRELMRVFRKHLLHTALV